MAKDDSRDWWKTKWIQKQGTRSWVLRPVPGAAVSGVLVFFRHCRYGGSALFGRNYYRLPCPSFTNYYARRIPIADQPDPRPMRALLDAARSLHIKQ